MVKRPQTQPDRSAFLPHGRRSPFEPALARLSLQEAHEIRLLLRGQSAIDWHRLGLRDETDVNRLLAVNGIDVDNPDDLARVENLRTRAVHYIRETLGLRLSEQVVVQDDPRALFLLASGRGTHQREACTLLKVMHILYHLDARELRMVLPIPDSELFSMVEQSVASLFDDLRGAGVPVVEFSWSRKVTESLVTKLLVKRESSAARVFDRLRFRLIVERPRDLLPTLRVMLQRFIPFNYVVPNQAVNTLVDTKTLDKRIARGREFSADPGSAETGLDNEFSGRGYQILNFVADLPVRIDGLLKNTEHEGKGSVVFVLAEFQIVDKARSEANEEGENSHAQYKRRQHQRVCERLLREQKKSAKR